MHYLPALNHLFLFWVYQFQIYTSVFMIQSIQSNILNFSIYPFQLIFLYGLTLNSYIQSFLIPKFIMFLVIANGFHCDLVIFQIIKFASNMIDFDWWDTDFTNLLHCIQIYIFWVGSIDLLFLKSMFQNASLNFVDKFIFLGLIQKAHFLIWISNYYSALAFSILALARILSCCFYRIPFI